VLGGHPLHINGLQEGKTEKFSAGIRQSDHLIASAAIFVVAVKIDAL